MANVTDPDAGDEMRPEYDFSGGVRGKYAERYGRRLSMEIVRKGGGFVSLCPGLDVASQGDTAEEARANLAEALELFFEVADESEIRRRMPEMTGTPVVHSDPEIVSGEPVFVGTRVPAQNLVEWLIGGYTLDEFLDNFPSVTREQAITFLRQGAAVLLSKLPLDG